MMVPLEIRERDGQNAPHRIHTNERATPTSPMTPNILQTLDRKTPLAEVNGG